MRLPTTSSAQPNNASRRAPYWPARECSISGAAAACHTPADPRPAEVSTHRAPRALSHSCDDDAQHRGGVGASTSPITPLRVSENHGAGLTAGDGETSVPPGLVAQCEPPRPGHFSAFPGSGGRDTDCATPRDGSHAAGGLSPHTDPTARTRPSLAADSPSSPFPASRSGFLSDDELARAGVTRSDAGSAMSILFWLVVTFVVVVGTAIFDAGTP